MSEEIYSEKVRKRILKLGKGSVFSPADFADIAGAITVRKILARMVGNGTIRRLMRGVYDYPSYSSLLGEFASPDPEAIAQALARSLGWTIRPSGNTALNALGLSTQIPARWEYLSDGPYRTYEWLGMKMEFKHRANRELTVLSFKSALVVQALKSLGKSAVDTKVRSKIARNLTEKEKKTLLKEARIASDWIYDEIKIICEEGTAESE
ncbi:MAG TPA: DUF6088 family protein [Treponemataceae bacterium]|nr:DUF6088 family protein [Treponemataceae bacterium]HPS44021.1 DUF6088 family protein [Treponemataceae bacterium]